MSNSLSPVGPALDGEYDLEKQSWCLSVNEEAYLEKGPSGSKTTDQIFR